MDSRSLQALRDVAAQRGILRLMEACDIELTARGALALDKPTAERHAIWAETMTEAGLVEVIVSAFTEVPAYSHELDIIQWIANEPDITHARLVSLRGQSDIGLIVGHFVYERYGFFRAVLIRENPQFQSDLLLHRRKSAEGTHYRLRDEAREAFAALKLI